MSYIEKCVLLTGGLEVLFSIVSMQSGYAHPHGILTAYIFFEDLAGEKATTARKLQVQGQ